MSKQKEATTVEVEGVKIRVLPAIKILSKLSKKIKDNSQSGLAGDAPKTSSTDLELRS